MSPVRVSVMLSLVAVATSNLVMVGGQCSEFVEQPSKCSETPGCKVVNGWDCVPEEDAGEPTSGRAKVWLQFPDHLGVPAPDMLVDGVPVEKEMLLADGIFETNIPKFLKDTRFHAVRGISRGGGLRFECPESHTPCDFFVTVFGCGGPCGEQVDGGLPQLLTVTNGWEPRSCAPTLAVSNDGAAEEHKMKIFRVRVPGGLSMATPRLSRSAHYIGVFSSEEATEYCPIPAKVSGPFPPGKTCGDKCPFHFNS